MTVVSEGPLCLKIHLNKYELKKYFTGYSKIKFDDPEVKKTISMLLDIASNMTDFELKSNKMIEVFPTASGGCILKFTSDPFPIRTSDSNEIKNFRLKSKTEKNNPYIFRFESFNYLITVIEELFKNNHSKNYTCSLYQIKKKYYLKIVIPIFDIKTGLFINEFSSFSTKGNIAECLLEEYGKCIIRNNAIVTLGKSFCKRRDKL